MASAARLIAAAVLAAVIGSPVPALAVQPADGPGPLDRAFARLYNFDFAGGLAILDEMEKADPQNPLVSSTRAAAFLFMELNRMRILETRFFMSDDNMVDGSSRKRAGPGGPRQAVRRARPRPEPGQGQAGHATRRRGRAVRAVHVRERRNRLHRPRRTTDVAEHEAGAGGARARTQAARPHAAVLRRLRQLRRPRLHLGELPFFVRWFVRIDGVKGNKRQGIEQLKLAAYHGRYYAPFARILLVVVSLREKKLADAEELLAGLVRDFPENPVLRKELAIVRQRARRAKQ